MKTKICFSMMCVILCCLVGMGCSSGGSSGSNVRGTVKPPTIPIKPPGPQYPPKPTTDPRRFLAYVGSLIEFSSVVDPTNLFVGQSINYVNVGVGDSAFVTVNLDVNTDLYDSCEVRVVSPSGMIAISYMDENVYDTVKILPPQISKVLKIYGLNEGTAEIEIWAISSWGDKTCIAGNADMNVNTAISDQLVVEVTL